MINHPKTNCYHLYLVFQGPSETHVQQTTDNDHTVTAVKP